MNWWPGPAVCCGMVFGASILPLLLALSHGALRVRAEKTRFARATAIAVAGWAITVAVFDATGWPTSRPDVIAGALTFFTLMMAFEILWGLICWGFTSSLLAALAKSDRPLSAKEWFRVYGGGSSLAGFADDRLSLLLAAGLARRESASVIASGAAGRLVVAVVRAWRAWCGFR